MRTVLAAVFVAGVISAAAADDAKDPTTGTWVIESVTRAGAADDSLKGAKRVHDGSTYTVTPAAGSKAVKVTGAYTLDATKTPMTIDMKPSAGRYKDKTLPGIVKVGGDTLTLCFAEPGKDRPTTFEAKDGHVLVVHTKAK